MEKIARFRDIVVHHYFKVDLDVVWDIVENKMSSLHEAAAYLLTLER